MKHIKRIAVVVAGGTVLALIVLPGPALVVIPLGLAILAAEFAWARRLLRSARTVVPFGGLAERGNKKKVTVEAIRRSVAFLSRRMWALVVPRRRII